MSKLRGLPLNRSDEDLWENYKMRASLDFGDHMEPEIPEGLVYYDVGSFPDPVFPFIEPQNHIFLKKYIGIDPRYSKNRTEGKYVFYNCACGESDCVKKFHVAKQVKSHFRSGIGRLRADGDGSFLKRNHLHHHAATTEFNVNCRKLSTIVEEQGGEIDILKIDAHGSELTILREAEKILERITAINVELWAEGWYEGVDLLDYVHKFISDKQFSPVKIIETFENYAVDLLYVNQRADPEKVKLIEKLYEVNETNRIKKCFPENI